MKRLNLNFGKRSYDIVINNSFDMLASELARVCAGKVLIVSDTNVSPLYKNELEKVICNALRGEVGSIVIDAGEKSKNIDTLQKIYTAAIECGLGRTGTIIALGGGVVGDIAGLAAATYMRGINFVQIPTTLLAQTDSSVGGKVGIDFEGVKNIVGAFKQPSLVYINTSTLKTLPKREFSAGMAEVIKYGIIKDEEFLHYLDENVDAVRALDDNVIENIIYKCCAIKAEVVMEDETEGSVRAILNFGHTIGHGIESAKNFLLLHGECVAIGMLAALDISRQRGYIGETEFNVCRKIMTAYGLETSVNGVDLQTITQYIKNDKKKLDDRLRYIIARRIGEVCILDDITQEETENAIKFIMC